MKEIDLTCLLLFLQNSAESFLVNIVYQDRNNLQQQLKHKSYSISHYDNIVCEQITPAKGIPQTEKIWKV